MLLVAHTSFACVCMSHIYILLQFSRYIFISSTTTSNNGARNNSRISAYRGLESLSRLPSPQRNECIFLKRDDCLIREKNCAWGYEHVPSKGRGKRSAEKNTHIPTHSHISPSTFHRRPSSAEFTTALW